MNTKINAQTKVLKDQSQVILVNNAKELSQWNLNKEALFAQTRKLYSDGQLGNQRLRGDETQDWS